MRAWNLFGIAVLTLALGAQQAFAEVRQLLPTVDGGVLDQGPFDGEGDAVEEGSPGTTVGLNSGILDFRAVWEFDLQTLHSGRRIESATLQVVPLSISLLSGTSIIPIQLFGFKGDGSLQTDDFNQGRFIAVFNGLASLNVPISVDVTDFVRSAHQVHRRFAGFSLRTNVHGAFVTFGSLELGSSAILIVTLRDRY